MASSELRLFVYTFLFVSATGIFCPSGCTCDHDSLVNCSNTILEVVPILLNPRTKHMDLSRNNIRTLSHSLNFYSSLEVLNLSYNNLKSLGEGNFQSQNMLRSLDLSFNNLSLVNRSVFNGLTSLHRLRLNNNQLSELINGSFLILSALEELYLSNNKLRDFRKDLFGANNTLKVLSLNSNQLRYIPSGLSSIPNLEKLVVCGNSISEIPNRAFQNLNALTVLSLDKNNIIELSHNSFYGLRSLKILTLADNRISFILPRSLMPISSLNNLDLSGNLFSALKGDLFTYLPRLITLKISRCPRLHTVFEDAFLSASSLENLVLNQNPRMSDLQEGAFIPLLNLKYLDVSASGLPYLKPVQVPLNHLATLKIAGNPLHCNCTVLWLAKILSLNQSPIADKPTCASPPSLYGMLLADLTANSAKCEAEFDIWTVVICAIIVMIGIVIIVTFLLCRQRCCNSQERSQQDSSNQVPILDPSPFFTHLPTDSMETYPCECDDKERMCIHHCLPKEVPPDLTLVPKGSWSYLPVPVMTSTSSNVACPHVYATISNKYAVQAEEFSQKRDNKQSKRVPITYV